MFFIAYYLLLQLFFQLHPDSLHFSITHFPFPFYPIVLYFLPFSSYTSFYLQNPFFNLSSSSLPLPSFSSLPLNFPSRFFPYSISHVQLPSNSPTLLSPPPVFLLLLSPPSQPEVVTCGRAHCLTAQLAIGERFTHGIWGGMSGGVVWVVVVVEGKETP